MWFDCKLGYYPCNYTILYRPVSGRWQSQGQSQCRGQSQHKASPGEATPSASIAQAARRQGKMSQKQGSRSVAPRYPWVGKTMEGVTPWEDLKPR